MPTNLSCHGVEVIIINWNTRDLLQSCLKSLFEFGPTELPEGAELKVTVVDNASKDGSVEMVQTLFPAVHLIANEKNVGFAKANNQAMAESNMDFFLLLNSDTLFLQNSLKPLFDFMLQNPKAGICGPRLLNADYSLQPSCQDFSKPLPDFLNLLELYRFPRLYNFIRPNQQALSDHKQMRSVDIVKGACMLVRHKAYKEAGPMDAEYFFYGEEVDWCYRFWKIGWEVWFIPEAKLVHYGGESSQKVPYDRIIWLHLSYLRFYRKFYSIRLYNQYCLILVISALLKLLVLSVLILQPDYEKRKHRYQLIKTYWKILWLPLKS